MTDKQEMRLKYSKASELLPSSEYEKNILQERKNYYSATINDEKVVNNEIPYIRFRINKSEFYGVNFKAVNAILQHVTLNKPPCTPQVIKGIVNSRGMLITVIDIRVLLGLAIDEPEPQATDKFVIIVNSGDKYIGIQAEEIVSDDSYRPDEIVPAMLTDRNIAKNYIYGIDKKKTAIINIEAVIDNVKI